MAINNVDQDFITKNGIIILGTAHVTSSTDQYGSLQVNGGAAIAKNLIVGTTSTFHGPANFNSDAHFYHSIAVDNTATIQDLRVNGLLDAAGGFQLSGGVEFTGTATFTGPIVSTGSYATNLSGTLDVDGVVTIHNATTATMAPQGALIVQGGEYIGANLIVASTASGTTVDNNALYVVGGIGVGGNLVVAGTITAQQLTIEYTTVTTSIVTSDDIISTYNTTQSTSTNSGALQVAGGIGVGLDIYVGGNVNGGALTSRGFTVTNGIVFANSNGTLVSSKALWDQNQNKIDGTITRADTATYAISLIGGATGSLPYQTTASSTAFIPLGSNGTFLSIVEGQLSWVSAGSSAVGSASTATNIKGGTAGAIPFQVAEGTTGFDGTYLKYTNSGTTASLLTVFNLASTSSAVSSTVPKNNAIYVEGGAYFGSKVWVNNTLTVTSQVAANVTGAGALHVDGGIYVANNVYIANSTTNALSIIGGGSIGKELTIQSSVNGGPAQEGALVLYNGGAYVDQDVYANGQLSGNSVQVRALAVNRMVYADSVTQLASSTIAYNTVSNKLEGTITQADNISGGSTGAIPFQSASSSTTFDSSNLYYSSSTLYVTTLSATNATVTNTLNALGFKAIEATVTNLTVLGVTSIGGISLSNATANNLTVTNTLVVGQLITATNAVFTGTVTIANESVTGTLGTANLVVGTTATNTVVPAIYSNNTLLASYTSGVISSTGTVSLDHFTSAIYRTARYTTQVVDVINTTTTKVHISEITVFHDGNNVYLDEYGVSTSAGELGTFSANITGGVVTLTFTPISATAMTIKVVRFGITA